MPSAKFATAWNESKTLAANPTPGEQLDLYAYGKIVKGGEPKKGGLLDPTARAMYNKWKELTDAGVTESQAEAKYIALVASYKKKYGTK
ncbi:diazepam-binding inhibitor [Lophiotrema nucula]|uniref:Diazepam-binding inhibitor n=1 Tax=Lophiotrema nucula TaxID=690887 RepID=A0A6A5Z1Y1_9PLEO|nr:diazepam-binding inhibitor [Lophiotrema nucula]